MRPRGGGQRRVRLKGCLLAALVLIAMVSQWVHLQDNARSSRQLRAFIRQFQLLFNNPKARSYFGGASASARGGSRGSVASGRRRSAGRADAGVEAQDSQQASIVLDEGSMYLPEQSLQVLTTTVVPRRQLNSARTW